jgi:hypothetical protein
MPGGWAGDLVGPDMRAVIREVSGADRVAAVQCCVHGYADPGKPKIAWNDAAARAVLADGLVIDAVRLLGHLPEQELGDEAANAVGILALVAGQDVEPAEDSDGRNGRRRIARGTAENRMVSTVDPEARHVRKARSHQRDGPLGRPDGQLPRPAVTAPRTVTAPHNAARPQAGRAAVGLAA